jgi:hypothetical protein
MISNNVNPLDGGLNTDYTKEKHLQDNTALKEKLGVRACARIKTMIVAVETLRDLSHMLINQGVRTTCAGTTILAGLQSIYSGNLLTGGALTAAGVKELLTIWRARKHQSKIVEFLDNANAGTAMIEQLQIANESSQELLTENLNAIREDVEKTNKRMAKVKGIASEGSEKLKKQKTEATAAGEEATKLFNEAQKILETSQKRINKADQLFSKAFKKFDQLFAIANEAEGDPAERIQRFLELAKQIHRECLAAQKVLEDGNKMLEKGLKLLNTARVKQDTASYKAGKAIGMAYSKLAAIAAIVEVESECKKKIEEAQGELKIMQARHEDQAQLLTYVNENLEGIREHGEGFGNISLIGGIVAAAAAQAAGGAMPVGVVAGLAGANIVHNRHYYIRKVGDQLFGINSEETIAKPELAAGQVMSHAFDTASSGFFNRYMMRKSQSWTVGTLVLDLGEEKFAMRFNFNQKEKIASQDLIKLQNTLAQMLKDEKIDGDKCLDIIKQLEDSTIYRPIENGGNVKGFVPKECIFLNDIRRQALAQASNSASAAK